MKSETRNNFLLLMLLSLTIASGIISAQEDSKEKNVFPPVTIHRAETHILKSKINDQTYPIDIALPGSYFTSNKSYPVVYMLDAYSSFGIMVQMARLMAFDKEIPEVIIVGISSEGGSKEFNYNRARDYTPTHISPEKLPENYRSSIPASGGAEKFLGFIKEELIPYAESNYRIKKDDRTLEGHSLGGLFVLYSMFKEPELFNRYIAVSPALLWDDNLILKLEENFSKTHTNLNANIYTAVGSLEGDMFISPWKQLTNNLKSRRFAGMKLKTEIAESETHYTIIPYIVSHGLKSVFAE